MQYRRLGASGLKVSEISLGSWLTYGGYVERQNAVQAIESAYELGVNFFDTANVYERGEAEKVVGETLKAYPRESYVLATKVFGAMGDGPNDRGLSRKHVTEQCHASLKRLGHDYIDLYYCHRFDDQTPMEETLRALDDLLRQGKILYVGVSMWTAAQMAEALAIADRYLLDRIVVNQPVYNLFDRHIEKEIIPFGERNGIGQVVYSPLAQGLLTGKYSSASAFPEDSRASKLEGMRKGITPERIDQVRRLAELAGELNITVGQLAIAWILRQSNVSSALVGASRPEQVKENVMASGIALTQDVLSRIEEITAPPAN
ncbi:aldo/keto reductase family protein [Paenibacillus melissococcoides]|uniref:Aldo/keto reductase family protein n=1 Tax=Paenibacillus melissococcoides TaxID=2912268 RepID=A0ABM9FW14_9BACL|nr:MULTISPECIES: aldo/keto reductase family protein [Paenibacillus]MEB9894391.1 aldo/keto reductase family protein [Bacillus cereus]CAH8243351.1 aldo/keto reductase family protein [Paenibacillus melissococcoides]CAH8704254.1 aldo/keto reductase family protein [Paenibacillus melissococcoides]CAH8707524.1 aldo/keto reductase family protein [Paenibacillus melissococcoides]GIO77959.1 voltage-gated potassium channel [Paenibacillus dendritiformis]